MFIYYDEKTDFFEVLERRCENISNEIEEGIFEIRSQSSKKIIGYSILDASKRIKPSDIKERGFWEIVDKYTFRVEWSEEDGVYISSCLEMPSLKAHGKTSEKALHEAQSVVSDAIAWMEKDGEEIPEPLSLIPKPTR